MNTSQPQDSLRKKLKKLKKLKKVEKERSKNGDSIVAPAPSRPWEAKHSSPSIQKLLRGPWLCDDSETGKGIFLISVCTRCDVIYRPFERFLEPHLINIGSSKFAS